MNAASESSARILVVDDDPELRELLAGYLKTQGLSTATAANGRAMWASLTAQAADLIVLDLNLPGTDGLSLCRELRERGSATPVIMLTARADPVDRIIGLELGADDYMPKPFEPRELVARIRTVLRRVRPAADAAKPAAPSREQRLGFNGWVIDVAARELLDPDGRHVVLTSGEFRLLRVLAEHAGHVLSRDQLLNHLQGRDAAPFDRSIDLHVSRLRAKLRDDAKAPSLLKTVRNEGYVLATQVEALR